MDVLDFGGWTPSSDVMCSIIQRLDNGLDNGLDNPDQVWIMEWISVCLSKGNTVKNDLKYKHSGTTNGTYSSTMVDPYHRTPWLWTTTMVRTRVQIHVYHWYHWHHGIAIAYHGSTMVRTHGTYYVRTYTCVPMVHVYHIAVNNVNNTGIVNNMPYCQ